MNYKKAMAVIIAAGMITASFTACSQTNNTSKEAQATATTVSQSVKAETTSEQSESTTAKNDESKVATQKVTQKNESTTNAKATTAATAKAGASKSKSTTAKAAKKSKKSKKNAATTKKSSSKSSGKTTAKGKSSNVTTTAKSNGNNSATPQNQPKAEESKETVITLKANGKATSTDKKVSIDSSISDGGKVTINSPGDYTIKSDTKSWHGQIIVKLKNTESADIRLENVNISTTNANAIQIIDASINSDRSFIEADVSSGTGGAGDTDNALQDKMKEVSKQDHAPNVSLSFPTGTSSSFSSNSKSISGVLYNESKLTIKGNGKVEFELKQNRNNAIASTKSVTFKNVDATLITPMNASTSSLGSARGIFCYSKVNVESGSLNIKSNGDGIRCEEFNSVGGKTTITSSASDGIDTDDAINITGGNVTVVALEKSCLKVRRVNNQEKLNEGSKKVKADDCIKKNEHTFKINGGTVIAMGKNITTLKSVKSGQDTSKQASIVCKSVKAKGSEEAKKPILFTVKGSVVIESSTQICYIFLYSSPSVDSSKEYTVSSKGYESEKVNFTGKAGVAKITVAN